MSVIRDVPAAEGEEGSGWQGEQWEAWQRRRAKLEALATLAGSIAHDFNNNLATMIGYTELALYDETLSNTSRHYLQEVLQAGERLRQLVRQILIFSGYKSSQRQPVHLPPLIEGALAPFRASQPGAIDIRQHLDTDVPPVLGDPEQLRPLLLHLCRNAEQAMKAAGGILEIRLQTVVVEDAFAGAHPPLRPGPHVCLTVRDTGPGMTPAVVEQIFDPFFTTRGAGEAKGLGLAVVHGVVTSHDGVITVESTPGQGTTFTIYLPPLHEGESGGGASPSPGAQATQQG